MWGNQAEHRSFSNKQGLFFLEHWSKGSGTSLQMFSSGTEGLGVQIGIGSVLGQQPGCRSVMPQAWLLSSG